MDGDFQEISADGLGGRYSCGGLEYEADWSNDMQDNQVHITCATWADDEERRMADRSGGYYAHVAYLALPKTDLNADDDTYWIALDRIVREAVEGHAAMYGSNAPTGATTNE